MAIINLPNIGPHPNRLTAADKTQIIRPTFNPITNPLIESQWTGDYFLLGRASQFPVNESPMTIVLAYSGGLDTSVLLCWLKETYQAEIIAFCANIGQEEELEGLEEKAKRTGASRVCIDDLQEEFARDFIYPMMQAGAIYEGQYFLGTSIARPLIAKRMVEIAQEHQAKAIAHGATGKGNDQIRFELAAAALAPEIKVIAPWRDDKFRAHFPGRAEMIAYCRDKEIPVEASSSKPWSSGPQSAAHLL